jgi:hypothetical protein
MSVDTSLVAMAFDPFINVSQPFTQAELETQLRALQEQYLNCQRILSTSAGDTSVTMQTMASLETSIEIIYRKLNSLDAVNYPIGSIVKIDRTIARFGNDRPVN